MIRSITLTLSVALIVLAAVGCSAQQPQAPTTGTDTGIGTGQREATMPPTQEQATKTPDMGGKGLYNQLNNEDYKSWSTAPGYTRPQPAKGPHGDRTQIFLSPSAQQALADGASQWPMGAVIVKDIYVDGELVQIAAMRKQQGGWYWGEYEPGGNVITEGLRQQPCEGCHASGTDSTLAVTLGQ